MKSYEEAVKEIYNCLPSKDGFFIQSPMMPEMKEPGLWTYWQGRGVRNPKIMIVGQDWGSISQSEPYFRYILEHPDAEVVSFRQVKEAYGLKKRGFTTDEKLECMLCQYFGCPMPVVNDTIIFILRT